MEKLKRCGIFVLAAMLLASLCLSALASSGLTLPRSVKVVEAEAFLNVPLEELLLPSGIGRIEKRAFAGTGLSSVFLPESLSYIAPDAFDGCEGLTIRGVEGSLAEQFASDRGFAFVPTDERYVNQATEWYLPPTLKSAEGSGTEVCLQWSDNGVSVLYGIYEVVDGCEALRATSTRGSVTLYGVSRQAHTYLVRALRQVAGGNDVGMPSEAMTVDLTVAAGDDNPPSPPSVTYADETKAGIVTLRWTGDADSFKVMEFDGNGATAQRGETTKKEIVLEGVSSGSHTYGVQAVSAGGTAMSALRTLQVFGAALEVTVSPATLSLYPGESFELSDSVLPSDGPDNLVVRYESSDETVATTFGRTVTGEAAGTCVVRAYTAGGAFAECAVTVKATTDHIGDFRVINGELTTCTEATVSKTDGLMVIPGDLGIWKIRAHALAFNPLVKKLVIPEGVKVIGERAFIGCSNLEEVVIPDSVEKIEDEAFAKCTRLTSLILPNTDVVVGYEAFSGCTGLKDIRFPNTAYTVQNYAFKNCTGLVQVDLRGNGATVSTYAFGDCDSLESIVISGNGVKLYNDGLRTCDMLTSVTVTGANVVLDKAFSSCKHLTKALLKGRGLTLGGSTFSGCESLTDVRFGVGLTVIGDSCFSTCKSLKSLTLPEGVIEIGASAFHACSTLVKLELPGSLRTVGAGAFYNCSALTALRLPEGMTDVGDNAFMGCTALTSLNVPTTLTTIGNSAFKGLGCITAVELTGRNALIDQSAFQGCVNLTSLTTRGNGTSILGYAFKDCTALSHLDLLGENTTVQTDAFYGCTSITEFEITDNLLGRPAEAFSNCVNLKKVVISDNDSMWVLGKTSFQGCTSLDTLIVTGNEVWLNDNCFESNENIQTLIVTGDRVEIKTGAFYKASGLKRVELLGRDLKLGNSAFRGCEALETVRLGGSVSSSGGCVFYDCPAIKRVELCGDIIKFYGAFNEVAEDCRVDIIGDDMSINYFVNCSPQTLCVSGDRAQISTFCKDSMNLRTLEISGDDAVISKQAFSGCKNLSQLSLSGHGMNVGESAFQGCEALTYVRIPGDATLGASAFKDCVGLGSVDLENGLAQIPAGAFLGCTALSQVDIPGSATIGSSAFQNTGLTRVRLGNGVKTISSSAFSGCVNLTDIDLPDSVTGINSNAFSRCVNLSQVDFPAALEYLNTFAFSGCNSLTRVELPEGLKKLYDDVFNGCSALTELIIPGSETDMDKTALESINEACVVYGVEGSSAQESAVYCKLTFVPLDGSHGSGEQPVQTGDVVTDEQGRVLMGTGMRFYSNTLFGRRVMGLADMDFTSSDAAVAAVDGSYLVALKPGVVTVRAQATDDASWVTRQVRVLGGFNATEIHLIEGETFDLSWSTDGVAAGAPALYTGGFSSSADAVSLSGAKVTALKSSILPGCVRMSVGGVYSECRVYVYQLPESFSLTPESPHLAVGNTVQLTPELPAMSISRQYSYRSADPAVATADARTGLVKAKAIGRTTITATAEGGATADCTVTVLPEGIDDEKLNFYLNEIDLNYTLLERMGLVFDGGYTATIGGKQVTVAGVNIDKLADKGVQKVYAAILGDTITKSNAFSSVVKAYYLSDLIMSSLATIPEMDYVSLEPFADELRQISDFTDVTDKLVYLVDFTRRYADDTERFDWEKFDWYQFNKDYETDGVLSGAEAELKALSIAKDIASVTSGIIEASKKYGLYKSVPKTEVTRYVNALRQSDNDALRMTANLLEAYKSPKCYKILLAFYGFPATVDSAMDVLGLLGKASAAGVYATEIASYVPLVGPLVAGVTIGKVTNSVLLNIDSLQTAIFRAQYAVHAANAYRGVYTLAYTRFRNDPLDSDKYRQFLTVSDAYAQLINAEYRAYSEMPNAISDSVLGFFQNLTDDQKWKKAVRTFEEAADRATVMLRRPLENYAREVLGISA